MIETGIEFDEQALLGYGKEAGELALRYFGNVKPQRKKDHTYVTEADRAVEALMRERLASLTPGWPVLGEEGGLGESSGRQDAPVWVLDPVDGTSAFASGLPIWTVSLGLVHRGQAVWGMVYSPVMREMIHAGLDGRVYRNGEPYESEDAAPLDTESVLYVPTDIHRCYRIEFIGKCRSLGSAAYHGVLSGRAGTAGVLQGRIYLWDAAAMLAINRAWGMRVAGLDGAPVTPESWNERHHIDSPVLICRPEHFDQLAGGIQYDPGNT